MHGAGAGSCCTKTAINGSCVCRAPGERVLPMMQAGRDCCARDTGEASEFCASLDISATYTLMQVSSGRFMDAHLTGEDDKDFSVVTRGEQEDDTQSWIFTRVGPGNDASSGIYTIQQAENERYLDAHLTGGTGGEEDKDFSVVTRGEQGDDTQSWIVTKTNVDGVYTIDEIQNFFNTFWNLLDTNKDNDVSLQDGYHLLRTLYNVNDAKMMILEDYVSKLKIFFVEDLKGLLSFAFGKMNQNQDQWISLEEFYQMPMICFSQEKNDSCFQSKDFPTVPMSLDDSFFFAHLKWNDMPTKQNGYFFDFVLPFVYYVLDSPAFYPKKVVPTTPTTTTPPPTTPPTTIPRTHPTPVPVVKPTKPKEHVKGMSTGIIVSSVFGVVAALGVIGFVFIRIIKSRNSEGILLDNDQQI